jgi:Recombination endonuclease VII
MLTKHCNQCNTTKPISDFGTQRGKPRHHCKECKNKESKEWYEKNKDRKRELSKEYKHIKKDKDLKSTYGISLEDYNQMLAEQSNCCKICGTHKDNVKRTLCVDHCHITGKVRGLLCDTCNRSLGLLKDSVEILKKAIEYLEDNTL